MAVTAEKEIEAAPLAEADTAGQEELAGAREAFKAEKEKVMAVTAEKEFEATPLALGRHRQQG